MKSKYDPRVQQPFNDPVVRCDSCSTLLHMPKLVEEGRCWKCGNRRVRNVVSLTGKEKVKMVRKWNIDPEFLGLFEEVEDE